MYYKDYGYGYYNCMDREFERFWDINRRIEKEFERFCVDKDIDRRLDRDNRYGERGLDRREFEKFCVDRDICRRIDREFEMFGVERDMDRRRELYREYLLELRDVVECDGSRYVKV